MEEYAGFVANGHQKRVIAESAHRNHRVSLCAIFAIATTQVERPKGHRLRIQTEGIQAEGCSPRTKLVYSVYLVCLVCLVCLVE